MNIHIHRKDAKDAKNLSYFLLSAERAESKNQHPYLALGLNSYKYADSDTVFVP